MYIAIAVAFLFFDWVSFFCPIGSLIFLYVTIAKPEWFKNLIDKIYAS